MGGGFVMIPLMTSSFIRLSQHQAHGTSLFAVTTTGMAGALAYSGQVDYEAAAAIACCGMVTAGLGASVTTRISEKSLRKALGVFMLCVAPLVPAKTYLIPEKGGPSEDSNLPFPQRLLIPACIGTCSGFLAGLFGVGGGAIVVPALTVAMDMNHYQALGTSLCAMSLPAMIGTATHYSKGNVCMRVAPALAMGAFMGGYFGGKLGLTVDEDKLKWGFSCLMFVLGARTFMK
jgi:putative Ca2+/H+ antiporter (TMEM165/GDT1 family)